MKIKNLVVLCSAMLAFFHSPVIYAGSTGWYRNDPGSYLDRDSVLSIWMQVSNIFVNQYEEVLDLGPLLTCIRPSCPYIYEYKRTVPFIKIKDIKVNSNYRTDMLVNNGIASHLTTARRAWVVVNTMPASVSKNYTLQFKTYIMRREKFAALTGVMVDADVRRRNSTFGFTEYYYRWISNIQGAYLTAMVATTDEPISVFMVRKIDFNF